MPHKRSWLCSFMAGNSGACTTKMVVRNEWQSEKVSLLATALSKWIHVNVVMKDTQEKKHRNRSILVVVIVRGRHDKIIRELKLLLQISQPQSSVPHSIWTGQLINMGGKRKQVGLFCTSTSPVVHGRNTLCNIPPNWTETRQLASRKLKKLVGPTARGLHLYLQNLERCHITTVQKSNILIKARRTRKQIENNTATAQWRHTATVQIWTCDIFLLSLSVAAFLCAANHRGDHTGVSAWSPLTACPSLMIHTPCEAQCLRIVYQDDDQDVDDNEDVNKNRPLSGTDLRGNVLFASCIESFTGGSQLFRDMP